MQITKNTKNISIAKQKLTLLQAEICLIPAFLQKNLKRFFGFLQRFDNGIDIFFWNMHFPIRLF